MKLFITSDANWESKINIELHALSDFNYRSYFEERNYGSGLNGIGIVFMCRNPELDFKRRIKFSKKEKHLSMDIMLDLPEMVKADSSHRCYTIATRLQKEIPEILSKYKMEDFDKAQFLADLDEWLSHTGWLTANVQPLPPSSTRW